MRLVLLLSFFISIQVWCDAQTRPQLKLDVFSTGYTDPLAVRNDGVNNWLYVVQRNGLIYVVDTNGVRRAQPFLNISNRVLSGGERGLLGLAFDPDFRNNQRFYVNYTRTVDGATVIASFKVSENDPFRADSLSQKILLTIPQPLANHNGGDIHFDKQGYLFIGMGDGGGAGDPANRAQNNNDLLGKMLRIKIESDSTYSIPPDNPFVGVPNTRPEIWASGLRNPWRFSFDRLTDDLWIADVGQSAREEVNYVPSPKQPGLNFGWRCYEGELPYNTNGCEPYSSYYAPIFTYDRTANGGRSITGGYVYRGSKHPDLYGYYVCADYLSRNFWLLKPGDSLEVLFQSNVLPNVVSFGEDVNGEMYLASFNGNIYRVGSRCTDLILDSLLVKDASCEVARNGSIKAFVSTNNGPLSYQWSVSGEGPEINGLSPGNYTLRVQNQLGCWLTAQATVGFGSIDAPTVTRSGDTLFASGNGNFQWLLDGEPIAGATSNFIVPVQNGNYSVILTDGDGCSAVSVPFAFQSTGWFSTSKIKTRISPNPAFNMLSVEIWQETGQLLEYALLDFSGRLIHKGTFSKGTNFLPVNDLASGIYFLNLWDVSGKHLHAEKILINR